MLTPTGAIRASWAVLMVLASGLMVAVASIFYAGHVAQQVEDRQERARHESDRRWCAVLAVQATTDPPPATERGRQLQRESAALMRDLGCEEKR